MKGTLAFGIFIAALTTILAFAALDEYRRNRDRYRARKYRKLCGRKPAMPGEWVCDDKNWINIELT